MAIKNPIPRAKSAESIGIDSSVIDEMTEEMARRGIKVHSMMVIRHSQVAMEGWSNPLTPEMSHMVYSVSKSVLATAYGFALTEGLLKRDTRVVDVIPEMLYYDKDENSKKLTIHHLITMTAGKRSSLKGVKTKDWIKSYAKAKWVFAPDEGWLYVNDNYYIASVMLTRILGQSVTDYLTPRLFEPLGIEVPFWERSSDNIESGGWGLQLRTEDMAKIILCYHNKGMYNGVQIIPSEWTVEATSCVVDNSGVDSHPDSSVGYGCGFWRCAGMKNTFRCEGMFCQYAISFGDYDACLVMTCEHSDLQETLDVIWQYMPKSFIEPNNASKSTRIRLENRLPEANSYQSEIQGRVSGNTYRLNRPLFANLIGFPVSVFPMPVVYFDYNKSGNINNVRFDFSDDKCAFSWSEDGDNTNSIELGFNGDGRFSSVKIGQLTLDVYSYFYWKNNDTLIVCIRPVAAVAERVLEITFKNNNRIVVVPSTRPSTDEKAQQIGDKLKCILKGRFFYWWIDFLVPRVGKILNPVHYGKAIK